MQFSISNYKPPGPVAAAYIRSDLEAPFIMGPAGGGKTMATIFKALRYTALMPSCVDGVTRAKGLVVRTDYRTLYRTTLSSWFRWFPKDFPNSTYTGGADRPATHLLRFATPRGRKIELTVEFAALGDNRIEDMLRGWEGTWAWLNEADLLDESALDFLYQRGARWPPKNMLQGGADLPRRIFGDLNPPGNPNHWIVRRFLRATPRETPDGAAPPPIALKLFQQPSGLSPNAENIANLPKDYYEGMVANMPEHDVQRFVHGRIGWDRSGMPVYPEFDARFNLAARPIKPIPGAEIHLGFDISGLHPGAVIVQRAPNLQLRVLEEFYFGRIGPTRFGEHLVAALEARYRDNPLGVSFYDPSNEWGVDKEEGTLTTIDIVRKAIGPLTLLPAPSNEIPLRIEAVRNQLLLPITAEARGLVVSPDRCPMLVEGFMSMYRFVLNPDGNVRNAERPKPDKNEHANIHDALQYVTLGLVGRAGAIASAGRGARAGALAGSTGNFVAKMGVNV